MPSSYTQSLRLILPVTGELTGTWGDAVNAGLTELVEDAIAGTAAIAMADANVTLTAANEAADQARNMFLNLTGAHTAQRDVIVPAVSKLYFVHNGTTGGFGVRVKTSGGSGVVVPNGARAALYCNGTNVVFAATTDFGVGLVNAADSAAARATLDVPTRTGGGASGIWSIGISGNAATATTATNASALGGVAASGYTKSTGTSEFGTGARTSGNSPTTFDGVIEARNAGGGGGTGTAFDAVLHNVRVGSVTFTDTGDGGCEVGMTYTPPGDPNTDRRVFGAFRLRNDGICEAKGFLPNGGAGAIGYPALLFSRSTNINIGSTYAGSSLRAQGLMRASDSVCTTADNAGPAQTGTWLALTTQSAGPYGCLAFFIRIS